MITFSRKLKSIIVLSSLCVTTVFTQDNTAQQIQSKQRLWMLERAHAESIAVMHNMPIRVEKSDGSTIELQRFEHGVPRYYQTHNLNAAKTISTNKAWPDGSGGFFLTGIGITLGEWDAGKVRTTHQEFGGRVTSTQGTNNFHSTHVAGTMVAAGVNASAIGMSYQATLSAFDWNSDESEMAAQAAGGLRVSNHSYGSITGWYFNYFSDSKWAWFGDPSVNTVEDYRFGFYDSEAGNWDFIAANAPYYLICKSAGNDRNEGPSGTVEHWVFSGGSWVLQTVARNRDGNSGFDCINGSGISKNILTVGAINDIASGYSTPSSVVMSSFSCWGPTDDGRIKPDIVANGVSLTSSLETADNAYGSLSGTSMASPNVAGSLGILLHHQSNLHGSTLLRSSTLKGIVIHTADEAGGVNGPDYIYGWGLMNTLKAVQLMSLDSTEGPTSHIREVLLTTGNTINIDISSQGLVPLKATICWTDPAGTTPAASLDPTTLMLRNDIDVRIIKKKDLTTYEPWILNPFSPSSGATTGDNTRDNVEQVYIPSTERAEYTVRITHKGSLAGGQQYVSLMVSGNVPSIGPIMSVQPDSFYFSLIPGATDSDSFLVSNSGDTSLVYELSVSPLAGGWLSYVHADSGNVASLGSEYIQFSVDAESLSQWSTYNGTLILNTNDSDQTPFSVPVTLQTLGPLIVTEPNFVSVGVDSGEVGMDTLFIRNNGYMPMHFSITDDSSAFPAWLSLSPDTGTISVGDSALIVLTLNSSNELEGNYTTVLHISSTDSLTGEVTIPVILHVGTRNIYYAQVSDKWNMVSLPVEPFTNLKTFLYPTAVSPAYGFDGNYVIRDTLRNGEGFWMKFNGSQLIPIDGYTYIVDTINVDEGWNIVGSLSEAIAVSTIGSIPSNIVNSEFFGYNGSYYVADSIMPGQGYWIYTNQSGQLVLNAESKAVPKARAIQKLSEVNSIRLSSPNGSSQTLYFGRERGEDNSGTSFLLPPTAPEGSFDARFGTNRMFAEFTDDVKEHALHVRSHASQVTVEWTMQDNEIMRYSLVDESGRITRLAKQGRFVIEMSSEHLATLQLIAENKQIPKVFSLYQNHPNPFNPTTVIRYDLPVQSHVTLKVYNLLGAEVATLVNEMQDAGEKRAEFVSQELPSGLYFYKLTAGRFTQIKKMLLLK